MKRRFTRDPRVPQVRVNHRIRVPEVRVVAEDGSNLGVLPTEEALRRAQDLSLDLVEVNPKASPPVCKILDFGKYKYEEKKRAREAKRRQTTIEVKEIKLRPKTDDHDLNVKIRHARKFFESGNKVKVVCRFRGREITHPEVARRQLEFIISKVEDLASLEQSPTMEGRSMTIVLAPRTHVLQRLSQERSRRAEQRGPEAAADAEGRSRPSEDEDDELHEPDDDDDDDEDDED